MQRFEGKVGGQVGCIEETGELPALQSRLCCRARQLASRDSHRMRQGREGGEKSRQAQRQLLGFRTMAQSLPRTLRNSEETQKKTSRSIKEKSPSQPGALGSVELLHPTKPGERVHSHTLHTCAHALTRCTFSLVHTHPRAFTHTQM